MALAVDSALALLRQLTSDLGCARDALALAGLLFGVKVAARVIADVSDGVRAYVLPPIVAAIKDDDFVRKYGKWALVTGCTQGIGKGYALELASRGMNIVLVSRNAARLDAVAAEIRADFGVETLAITADFTDPDAAAAVAARLADVDVGVLVNNVGMAHATGVTRFHDDDETAMRNMVIVNALAATMLSHALLPAMKTKGRGAVVNISSQACLLPMPYLSVYSATKHYMTALTEAIRLEYAPFGVTVQSVEPGLVRTQMTRWIPEEEIGRDESFSAPGPETFARSAVRTIGYTHRTCGYWFHGFQASVLGLIPRSLAMRLIANRFGKKVKMDEEAKKKK